MAAWPTLQLQPSDITSVWVLGEVTDGRDGLLMRKWHIKNGDRGAWVTAKQGGGHGAPLWYFCCVGLHAERNHCSVLESCWLTVQEEAGRQKQERVFSAAAEHNKPFKLGRRGRGRQRVTSTETVKKELNTFKFRQWLDIVKQKLLVSSPDQQMATEIHHLSCFKFYWKEMI